MLSYVAAPCGRMRETRLVLGNRTDRVGCRATLCVPLTPLSIEEMRTEVQATA